MPTSTSHLRSLRFLLSVAFFALISRFAPAQKPSQPAVEWRGVWITRFEWTNGNHSQIEQRLRDMMAAIAAGNCNAVVFQVRGQGDTLYPSREEPWSPLLSVDARRIDPVGVALREAKRRNLKFHAWFNLSVMWQSKNHMLPTDKNHPLFKHADARYPDRRTWLIHDNRGRPVQWGADDYVWLTPGNPEVGAYLRRQIGSFLSKYSVSGIHWDDRTGIPGGASNDPVSLVRFRGRGNPHNIKDLATWQRDALERMLSDIYVMAKARDSQLIVSFAPFGIADKTRISGYGGFKDAKRDFGTDPETWLAHGVVDVLMPQVYWMDGGKKPDFTEVARDWQRSNKSGRPIWPGVSINAASGKNSLTAGHAPTLAAMRKLGMGGITYFSWSAASNSEWKSASKTLFPTKASVPQLPRPATGHIMGYVLDAKGNPMTDVWIRITGRSRVYLSSADGFFAIPHVGSGTKTLTIDAGSGLVTQQLVKVQSGKVAELKIRIGK